jgi:hypothetical protein
MTFETPFVADAAVFFHARRVREQLPIVRNGSGARLEDVHHELNVATTPTGARLVKGPACSDAEAG